MKHGLSATTVERLQNTLLHSPEVEKAVLYGSLAKGKYRPGSDIDLTLCGSELNHTLLTQINNELDDLFRPYQIDLSLMASLSHPDLLDHLRRVGVVLYEKCAAPVEPLKGQFASKQQLFINFVLQHYVTMGVQELAQEKLMPLLQLKCY